MLISGLTVLGIGTAMIAYPEPIVSESHLSFLGPFLFGPGAIMTVFGLLKIWSEKIKKYRLKKYR